MKKFAIILSGSGVYDGSEIHESTLSMLAIKRAGADYDIFAPDIDQHHVINHYSGDVMDEKRNVLVEAARIARGDIKPLSRFDAGVYDALLMPGGFGAAKNLSSFAFHGSACTVDPEVEKAIKAIHEANKPIGALCISPVVVAAVLGKGKYTIGQDADTAEALKGFGVEHVTTDHGEVTIDKENNIFTTPCYMLDANIQQIAEGAENVTKAIMEQLNE
ncbi:MAG: isoprenoid biosynthesis glyoxalase ElbB [Bacteroidales bacterium]|nr:isoprenoid biosynthesis glyoxalase ElbB [Bacteroidales bacterium]MCF8328201.1 isoprenoid biosynthesis glyoxalase ElbB [Bacteroidales bacterium]